MICGPEANHWTDYCGHNHKFEKVFAPSLVKRSKIDTPVATGIANLSGTQAREVGQAQVQTTDLIPKLVQQRMTGRTKAQIVGSTQMMDVASLKGF